MRKIASPRRSRPKTVFEEALASIAAALGVAEDIGENAHPSA
jgi:hypothetical protein